MHPEWPDGAEVQGVFRATLRGQPRQFVWFLSKVQGRLAAPGQHGNLQSKIKWHALPEWGEKAETSNLELCDDRHFPECPVQLRTPANQVPPGMCGEVKYRRHGWRSRIYQRNKGWPQRST